MLLISCTEQPNRGPYIDDDCAWGWTSADVYLYSWVPWETLSGFSGCIVIDDDGVITGHEWFLDNKLIESKTYTDQESRIIARVGYDNNETDKLWSLGYHKERIIFYDDDGASVEIYNEYVGVECYPGYCDDDPPGGGDPNPSPSNFPIVTLKSNQSLEIGGLKFYYDHGGVTPITAVELTSLRVIIDNVQYSYNINEFDKIYFNHVLRKGASFDTWARIIFKDGRDSVGEIQWVEYIEGIDLSSNLFKMILIRGDYLGDDKYGVNIKSIDFPE